MSDWYSAELKPQTGRSVVILYDCDGELEADCGEYIETGCVIGDTWTIDLHDCIMWCYTPVRKEKK